jgi:hypothetical protein
MSEACRYAIHVSVRNRCATAMVYRITGSFRRRIARTTWAAAEDDVSKADLARVAREHAWPLIVKDQRARGIRRRTPLPSFDWSALQRRT